MDIDAPSKQTSPSLHIRLFGSAEVSLGNQLLHLETAKTLGLLAYLALVPGPHRRSVLAGLLWGEQDEASAARSLRRALWNLRDALGGAANECPYLLVTRHDVAFNPESPYWLDVAEFTRLAAPSTDLPPDTRERQLQWALQLYRGPFLDGLFVRDAPEFEAWMLGQRATLQEMTIQALRQLSDLQIAQGRMDAAILTLRWLLALAPWAERAHRQLMLCYALAGQPDAALAQYEQCARALRDELGTEPLPETVRLYQRILRREIDAADAPRDDALRQARAEPAFHPMPFVGREHDHAWLLSRWRQAEQGEAGFTLIEGGGGIGKTRLVEQTLRLIGGQGAAVLIGRCYESSASIPYHPIRAALDDFLSRLTREQVEALRASHMSHSDWAELARLAPAAVERIEPRAPEWQRSALPLAPQAAQERLFAGLASLLRATGRCVLFIDDLHWADPDTLSLLSYLARALRRAPAWLVAAYRPEAMPLDTSFHRLCDALDHDGLLASLSLKPLTAPAVARIVEKLFAPPARHSETLAQWLAQESQGYPFRLAELLREMAEAGRIRASPDGWHWQGGEHEPAQAAAEHTEQMIVQRVKRLPEMAQWWLNLVAVLGAPFTRAQLVDMAGRRSPGLIESLELWQSHDLVRRVSESHYDFAHHAIREAIYAQLPAPLRGLLHERVGQALSDAARHDDGSIQAASIAYHFERCLDPRRAAPWLDQAAEAARQMFAHRAAIDYDRRLLAVLPRDQQPRILTRLARTWRLLGEWSQALSVYEQAVELAEVAGAWADLARALSQLANAREILGQYDLALQTARRAAQIAGETSATQATLLLIEALIRQGWPLYRMGRVAEARPLAERALALSEQSGNAVWIAHSLNLLSAIHNWAGQYDEGLQCLERAEALYTQAGAADGIHRISAVQARINQGYTLFQREDFEGALSRYRDALPATRALGDRSLEMLCLNNMGGALAALGQYEAAAQELNQVLQRPESQGWFLLSETHRYLAEALLGLGQIEAAVAAGRRALELARQNGGHFYVGAAWRSLGVILSSAGQGLVLDDGADSGSHDAAGCFAESARIFSALGAAGEHARTLRAWAQHDAARDAAPRAGV